MNEYTFCKKNGEIKKNYIFVCEQILKSEMQHHEICVGRSDKVIKEYNSITVPSVCLAQPKRNSYINKVKEICKCFNNVTHEWYSGIDVSIELLGDNVEYMLNELSRLLGGDDYIR